MHSGIPQSIDHIDVEGITDVRRNERARILAISDNSTKERSQHALCD